MMKTAEVEAVVATVMMIVLIVLIAYSYEM